MLTVLSKSSRDQSEFTINLNYFYLTPMLDIRSSSETAASQQLHFNWYFMCYCLAGKIKLTKPKGKLRISQWVTNSLE